MEIFRRIDSASSAADAIVLTLGRTAQGEVLAMVDWPERGQVPPGRVGPLAVPEALKLARARREEGGFAEIAVKLPAENLWRAEWGVLRPEAEGLSAEEAYELASATEASRDA
ncbi:MAG: hypothetical protein ABS76_22640 [Pelagibacterium sp. SCN 64-44]|nr:MAG: hypothetical protein ABS76_22640 [Pelagibacterium sp. SCN 64-44]